MIEAEQYNMAIGNEICGLPCPHHQILGWRVTEAQCQPLHWCHLDLIGLEAPGVHTGAHRELGGYMKSIYQSSRMRT